MIRHTTIESAILSFAGLQNIATNAEKLGKGEQYKKFVQDTLYYLKTKTPNCDLGLLFNALTEKKEAKTLISYSREENPLVIQADSGGLQQVTLGIKVDEEGKKGIYERQAKYSTFAMSFDKMPIMVDESKKTEGVSMSLDHSAKYFIREMLYDVGRESGYNVLDQCKYMTTLPKEEKKAKVLIIIQGSKFEDYKEYCRGLFSVFEELPEQERNLYYDEIGGLSMGMSGITNYFDLVDLYTRAPVELPAPEQFRNTIHFLGVGGPTKIAPLYAVGDNFFNGRNIHYTFDSTSRTSSNTYGRFTRNIKMDGYTKIKGCNLGRTVNANVKEHLTDIYNEFKHIFEENFDYDISDVDKFRNVFSEYPDHGIRHQKEIVEKFGEEKGTEIYVNSVMVYRFMCWAIELVKFYEILDEYHSGEFRALNNRQLREAVELLYKTETYEDYMQPKVREFIKLKLSKIKLGNINILETIEQFENLGNSGINEEEW